MAYSWERPEKRPWQRGWFVLEDGDLVTGKVHRVIVSDENGNPISQDDVAWIRMALASTGKTPASQVVIKDHFELPLQDAINMGLDDKLNLKGDELEAATEVVLRRVMQVLKKVNMLSFLSQETDFFSDEMRRCNHGYVICAPCGFVPPSMEQV